ncbi:hypothetical protein [Cytobacillus massiliigabonensis]|uniref:hypothetical protein n=1 Tax=Cytobacillus massiliigabonensis TaxID=1871011 RepID=UPI000C861737|nr:hypothetical protein [Cytobacillus massiliigabonensis]
MNNTGGTTNEHHYFSGVFSYVDENGEQRVSAPANTHRVVSHAQSEAYKAELEREEWQKGRQPSFTASNMLNLHEVYEVLTTAQCGYLMLLQCYVDFDGGTLVNTNKTPMTKRDMMDVLQLAKKPSTFYDFLDACITNSIIVETSGTFAVNPRYHFRGAFNDQYIVKSYTAKIKRVYREVKAADIGLIYRMLPFIHYETNALCANPFEANPALIKWFTRKALAEATGVSPGEISRRLPKMTFDGEYVIAQVTVGGKRMYMFNPWVFYRKNSAPDTTLQAVFNVKPKGGR